MYKNCQQLFITIIYLSLQILHNRAKKTEADQLCNFVQEECKIKIVFLAFK